MLEALSHYTGFKMNIPYDEYIKDFDIDKLLNLKEKVDIKIAYFRQLPKTTLYVVSDEWHNFGWYAEDNYRGAVKEVMEIYEKQIEQGIDDEVFINACKFNCEEAAQLLKEFK